ncbi:MAG TPA: glycosyltransferase family 87 protein [Rhizomicrobium sp.]
MRAYPTADQTDLRALAILGGLSCAAMLAAFYWKTGWAAPFPRDGTTLAIGRDFLNLWMYGRAAFAHNPAQFYDPAIYNHALTSMLGAGYPQQSWSYPPTLLPVAAPFGLLAYKLALLLWTGLGIAAFYFASARDLGAQWWIVLVSPAAVFCVMSGQESLLATAALIAIFAWQDRKPVLAGILIGLLTLKPQLGVLLPVMLIASGRWRAFTVAAITTIALVALTTALFGAQVWIEYWRVGIPAQNQVLRDTHILATHFMPTVFVNAHLAGASYGASMALQIMFAIGAAALVFWAFRRRANADPLILQALFFACSLAATPYLMGYDALPLAFVAVALLAKGNLDRAGRRLAQLAYWLPFVQFGLAQWHIPGAALIAPVFAVYLGWRLSDARPAITPAAARPLP